LIHLPVFIKNFLERGLVKRGGLTLADQVLSSGTNFATAIVVARFLGPADYGSYVIAFGAWLVVMGLLRAMVINPFVVKAAALHRDDWRLAAGSATGITLSAGVLAGLIIAAIGLFFGLDHPFGLPLFVLACFIPALVLQDFWRFAAFSIASPGMALCNDAIWTLAQAIAFLMIWLLVRINPAWMIAGWGAGALAGALFGLWQFQVIPSFGHSTFLWLKNNASLSGWLGLTNIIYGAGTQAVSFLIAATVGRAALGGIQSVNNLFGPASLISQASQTIGLPLASKTMAEAGPGAVRRVAFRYSFLLGLCLTSYTILLLIAGPFLLTKIFGEAFAKYYSLIVPLGLGFLLNIWGTGAAIGLTAMAAGSKLVGVQSLVILTQLISVALFGCWFGILGAAWGITAGAAMRFLGLWLMCLVETKPVLLAETKIIRLR